MEKSEPVSALENEAHGIDTIPEESRVYKPKNIFYTMYGANLTLSAIVLGAFPALFGLNFWDGVISTIIGLFLGGLLMSPMGLFGPKSGTNNAVTSGAHLGVVGRLIGSIMAFLYSITFAAISIWTTGDVISGTSSRVMKMGITEDVYLRAAVYLFATLVVMYIAVKGIHLVLRVQKVIMAPLMTIILAMGVYAFWGKVEFINHLDFAYQNREITWIANVIIMCGVVLTYGAAIGDWARYIPAKTSKLRLLGATFMGGWFGLCIPLLWGLFISYAFAAEALDFVNQLIINSPGWYLIPILILGLLAGVGQASLMVYGVGLDFSSVIPNLTRIAATILLTIIALVIVYLGAFVWNMMDFILALLQVMLVIASAWVVIMVLGYIQNKGYYYENDIQVFTRGETGGRYWYTKGWHMKALIPWLLASLVGCLFTDASPLFAGALLHLSGGISIGFIVAMFIAGIGYVLMSYIFPMPAYVFGPEGAAFGKVDETIKMMPIERRKPFKIVSVKWIEGNKNN